MIKKLKDNEDYSYLLLLKLMLVSIVIGLLVGFVDTVFGRVLLFLSDFRTEHFNYLIPFLGIIGLLIVFLYQKADERVSKGMGLVFAIGQSQEKEIPLILVPLVTLATWLTHLFGGSAGREGVAVQLGAAIAHGFSRFFDFENNSRLFLVTGMAAGFAGLFQTPIAAVFFALEILVLGKLQLQALLPMTVASFVASATSHSLGLEKFYHIVSAGWGTNLIEASFAGKEIYFYDWLLKLLLTVATLAIGFQGGEVTPLFAIGASLGVVLANLFGLPIEFVAAAGYISVFGSATNTLIAPIFIGGEVFGFANLPYFVVVMIFAYSVNRKHSIYGGQEVLTF